MEAPTKIDPYRMPRGLSLPERQWWTAMTAEAQEHKVKATNLERQGRHDQKLAQLARDDYGRLRQQYRDKHHDKPQWAVDITFKSLAVAQDCMTDDNWYSRQATEKYTAALAHYRHTSMIVGELAAFVAGKRDEALAQRPVPHPREAS